MNSERPIVYVTKEQFDWYKSQDLIKYWQGKWSSFGYEIKVIKMNREEFYDSAERDRIKEMRMDVPQEVVDDTNLAVRTCDNMNLTCHATLYNWKLFKSQVYEGWFLGGVCVNDSKRRFANGEAISTSRVSEIDFKNGWARTRNTLYKLVKERDEE